MHSNNAWIFGHKAQHKYIHNMIVNKINICLNRYTVLSIDKQLLSEKYMNANNM